MAIVILGFWVNLLIKVLSDNINVSQKTLIKLISHLCLVRGSNLSVCMRDIHPVKSLQEKNTHTYTHSVVITEYKSKFKFRVYATITCKFDFDLHAYIQNEMMLVFRLF